MVVEVFRALFCKTWRSGSFSRPYILRFSSPSSCLRWSTKCIRSNRSVAASHATILPLTPNSGMVVWPQTGDDVFVAVLLPSGVFTLCGGSCVCLRLGSASSQQDNPVRGRLRATFCARGGGMGGLRHGGLQPPVCCYCCCLMPHFNQRLFRTTNPHVLPQRSPYSTLVTGALCSLHTTPISPKGVCLGTAQSSVAV